MLLSVFGLHAQKSDEKPSYQKFRKEYKYLREKNYSGPGSNYYEPVPMNENKDFDYDEDEDDYELDPEDIERSRSAQRQNYGGSGGGGGSTGNKEFDPAVEDNRSLPEVDIPEPPDTDIKYNPPVISPLVWKVLLIVIGFILLAWIAYTLIKNRNPKDIAVSSFQHSDWNPELIPKTELELRLEAAMLRDDYRECVRIYFTFILKEMIRLGRIKWKKDLTNIDYLLQVSGKKGYQDFQESVRIYDLVWYGEYEITRAEYDEVVPHLEKNYQTLTTEHE